jgi:hypothetical protein
MLKNIIKDIEEAQGPIDLDLDLEYIDDDGIKLLSEAIKEAKVPVNLFLSYTPLTTAGLMSLAEAIKQARNEFGLCLVGNGIGDKGVSLLVDGIKETNVPLNLNLGSNNLGDEGAKLLGDAIKAVRLPLNLCLSGNFIRAEGANSLADGIKQAKGPLNIELSGNRIGDEGAMSFAVAIREKDIPLNLCLSGNSIGKDGIGHIAAAIERAKSPITLDVSGNNIGTANVTLLANAIKVARTPFVLDWSADGNESILHDAIMDNFVVDARKDPSKFLEHTKLNLCKKMLEVGLGYPSVLAMLVTSYISDDDLAWAEVATIRAVPGASYENKYSSINHGLLNSACLNIMLEGEQPVKMISSSKVDGCYEQKKGEGNMSSSASSMDANEKDGNDVENKKLGSALQAKFSNQQHIALDYLSNGASTISYGGEQDSCRNKESLLTTVFTWIKDLSRALQQQILSSFSMHQVLEALEEVSDPNKFISEQLSSKQLEEIFTTEYQSYYDTYDFVDSSTQYAQMSHVMGFNGCDG